MFWKLLTHITTTPYPVSNTAQTSADRNVEIPDHLHAKWSIRRFAGRMGGPLLNTANHACQKNVCSPQKNIVLHKPFGKRLKREQPLAASDNYMAGMDLVYF